MISIEEALNKKDPTYVDKNEWPFCRFVSSSTIYLANDEYTSYHYPVIQQYKSKKSTSFAGELILDFLVHYQEMIIHRINIIRNGQVIDKRPTAHYFVSDTIRSNTEQLHAVSGQLKIVLDDLQVGDILDFSYSVTDARPSMTSEFTASMDLRVSYPLMYRRMGVINR